MNQNPEIDAYIDAAKPFAKPILNHIRDIIHRVCPEVQEKVKWGFPHFEYRNEMMCSMASFSKHCAFGFWKARLMNDPKHLLNHEKIAMGDMGKIASFADLPDEEDLMVLLAEAMRLNDEGIKLKPKPKPPKLTKVIVPNYFQVALDDSPKAKATFYSFSLSHQNEYIRWISEAKTQATRDKRISTSLEWLELGRRRDWKYK
jgi:uncharacterized protein YdeI (YjbR/CyaY-like superfamily)